MNAGENLLYQFFSGYFHQDWRISGSTWQQVVDTFVNENPQHNIKAVHDELRRWLGAVADDRELAWKLTSVFACDYDPVPGGQSVREWLKELLRRLEAQGPW